MNKKRITHFSGKAFAWLSVASLGYVSILSLFDPHATMALVNVDLTNNDAISSIRGIYGGVGITIVISLIYLLIKDLSKALLFLSIFWGAYAASRLITILVDGALGAFGNQWLVIETVFCAIAVSLTMLNNRQIKA